MGHGQPGELAGQGRALARGPPGRRSPGLRPRIGSCLPRPRPPEARGPEPREPREPRANVRPPRAEGAAHSHTRVRVGTHARSRGAPSEQEACGRPREAVTVPTARAQGHPCLCPAQRPLSPADPRGPGSVLNTVPRPPGASPRRQPGPPAPQLPPTPGAPPTGQALASPRLKEAFCADTASPRPGKEAPGRRPALPSWPLVHSSH